MNKSCIVENWIMKNKSWIFFLSYMIGIWIIFLIGIMCYKKHHLQVSFMDSLPSLSNIINLGIAIGTIALTVFAWIAYKYATNQYIEQKKIDHVLNSTKIISSILHYHSLQLALPQHLLNRTLSTLNHNSYNTLIKEGAKNNLTSRIDSFLSVLASFRNDLYAKVKPELTIIEIAFNGIDLDRLYVVIKKLRTLLEKLILI